MKWSEQELINASLNKKVKVSNNVSKWCNVHVYQIGDHEIIVYRWLGY